MIQAEDWFRVARAGGLEFVTGVPCSYLKPFINFAISSDEIEYVGAASEGEAVGIAAGAWLGGATTSVICQGSGLGNMVNPLTSLCWAARIPTLLITTWRGCPGEKDEPQHALMGRAMLPLLDALEIPHEAFPAETSDIAPTLDRAGAAMEASGLPYAFVMRKGSVAPYPLGANVAPHRAAGALPVGDFGALNAWLSRRAALEVVLDRLGDECAFLGTTGKLGRELYTIADRPNHYYHVGAMGCVSGVGLGVALTRPSRRVVILDGDGSVLMKMGTLATIGHYAPKNLVHVVLDNERHDSTGGQATVSTTVDFATVAAGAGYRAAVRVADRADLVRVLDGIADADGPILLHVKVGVATDPQLVRPSVAPDAVARRFREWIAGGTQ